MTTSVARIRGARGRQIGALIASEFERLFRQGELALDPLIEADVAARAALALAPEPDLPRSAGRNVREPIVAGGP